MQPAKGIVRLAAVAALGILFVDRNLEAVGIGVFGLLVLGVLTMLGGLAGLFLAAASEA